MHLHPHMSFQVSSVGDPKIGCKFLTNSRGSENRTPIAMSQGALDGQRSSSVIPPQIPRRHKRDLVLCRAGG